MNFSEHSARVPLINTGPSVARGQTVNACLLVDLLPKIIKIGGGSSDMFGMPVDGRSLSLWRGEKMMGSQKPSANIVPR